MGKRNKDSAVMADSTNIDQNDKARAVQSRPALRVVCPSEGDVVARPSYTFHIAAASGADGVEVSIDQGDWIPCREALGLWWYDWSGFDKGDHEIGARSRMGDGISINSAPRRFSVD